jgi:hypothetical protein
MLGSFPEQQRQVIDQLMDQDDAKELAERMLAAGWTDNALVRFTVAQAIQGSAKVRGQVPHLFSSVSRILTDSYGPGGGDTGRASLCQKDGDRRE